MKLQQLQLSEGLIKVPERLMQTATKGLISTVLSQMASDIEEMHGPGSAVNQFRLWARKTYPGVRITHVNLREDPVEIKLVRLTKDDFDPRYQKMITGAMVVPRLVLVGRKTKGDAGEYDAEQDLITIALARAMTFDWDLFGRAIAAGERGKKAVGEILARVSDLITDFQGTLKHELMHYIQFNVLVNAHGDQVDLKRGEPKTEDDYYNSQTEFDPQIESAAASTLALIAKLNRNISNVDFRTVAAYITAAIPRERLVQQLGTDKFIPPQPLEFFATLKRVNPPLWNKAVKKFYQTLTDRLQ